jgi:hypothetical protein
VSTQRLNDRAVIDQARFDDRLKHVRPVIVRGDEPDRSIPFLNRLQRDPHDRVVDEI